MFYEWALLWILDILVRIQIRIQLRIRLLSSLTYLHIIFLELTHRQIIFSLKNLIFW